MKQIKRAPFGAFLHQTRGLIKQRILEIHSQHANTHGIGAVVGDLDDHLRAAAQAKAIGTGDHAVDAVSSFVVEPQTADRSVYAEAGVAAVGVTKPPDRPMPAMFRAAPTPMQSFAVADW